MKKIIVLLAALSLVTITVVQCIRTAGKSDGEIKNLIIMIPDGTSITALSLTRWYNYYLDNNNTRLAFDPYIRGLMKTHSSNAPIGDSAPTGTAIVTGNLSQTQFIGMYPPTSANDLVPVDPALAYSPRLSILKALQLERDMAAGLVFTCEFPHATPADCFAYTDRRSDYAAIQEQMVHNNIDVVIGGGAGLITESQVQTLAENNYTVLRNDLKGLRGVNDGKLWALFANRDVPYDIDRDTAQYPSLAEMTQKAIDLLSKNKDGFCLMVEGSKVDWASHDNNPVGIISEMRAFNEAVAKAIAFAEQDGNTLVVIVPDHGNSGLSIGNSRSDKGYDKLSLEAIIGPLAACKNTADTSYRSHSYIGFTTKGHTAEDVFYAVYHPAGRTPHGLVTAPELNAYMCREMGIGGLLPDLSDACFSKYTALFDAANCDTTVSGQLTVKEHGKEWVFTANSNLVHYNGKPYTTGTPAVYVKTNSMWYLSKECLEFRLEAAQN